MSTSDFISGAARQVRDGAPIGARARGEIARYLTHAAADDGHLPEEPEARRSAVRIADALEQDRAEESGRTAWARLNEVREQQHEQVLRVTGDLAEALRAMYPSAYALVVSEREGRFMSTRLVSAGGRSVRELAADTDTLPELPARLRERWPRGALARVRDLDEVLALLAACGLVFDDLPPEIRGEDDCPHSHIPVLLLEHGCEYGC
jgi:hypothetical protein